MPQENLALKYPKYHKSVAHLDSIDVYTVHQLFGVNDPSGALQHASKKLLLAGERTGGKPMLKDIEEARDTLTRYLELNTPTPSPVYAMPGFGIPEAANDPAPAVKLVLVSKEALPPTTLDRQYVILYYFESDSRRFKPRSHYALTATLEEAKRQFQLQYPTVQVVWSGEVAMFNSGADALSREYWAAR